MSPKRAHSHEGLQQERPHDRHQGFRWIDLFTMLGSIGAVVVSLVTMHQTDAAEKRAEIRAANKNAYNAYHLGQAACHLFSYSVAQFAPVNTHKGFQLDKDELNRRALQVQQFALNLGIPPGVLAEFLDRLQHDESDQIANDFPSIEPTLRQNCQEQCVDAYELGFVLRFSQTPLGRGQWNDSRQIDTFNSYLRAMNVDYRFPQFTKDEFSFQKAYVQAETAIDKLVSATALSDSSSPK